MEGQTQTNGRVLYRCRYSTDYAPSPAHPKNLYLAEARVLPGLDAWISNLFSPERRASTAAAIAEAAAVPKDPRGPDERSLRSQVDQATSNIERYRELLLEGADTPTVAAWINEAEADRNTAQRRLSALRRQSRTTLTVDDIREVVEKVGDVGGLLAQATPAQRQRLYEELGVELDYDPNEQTVLARQDATRLWAYGRVGGPSSPIPPSGRLS